MNVSCPECSSTYRIDPARVPRDGIGARCRECGTVFAVAADTPTEPGMVTPGGRVSEARGAEKAEAKRSRAPAGGAQAPAFGPQDPQTRAKRLARALVSDIVVYNQDKWEASRDAGTLRKEFRDEILKSWEEYVEQVGEAMAKKSPYFRDALNEILADGDPVF